MQQKELDQKTKCLIRYVELWSFDESAGNPPGESATLKLKTATTVGAGEPRKVTRSVSEVSKGESIAGSAWQQEAPVILQGPASALIEQTVEETGLPIKTMLAIPIYQEFTLVSVVVFGLTEGHGGLEIWTRDDRDELAISGSYYAGLPAFEFISQHVRFPKGAGLPGYCWKHSRPKVMERPNTNPNFIRSFDRDPADLGLCVGLPISREYGFPAAILLFLSDTKLPFASAMDVWRCRSEKPTDENGFPTVTYLESQNSDSGLDAEFCQSICDKLSTLREPLFLDSDSNPLPAENDCGLAIPFFNQKRIEHVFLLLF